MSTAEAHPAKYQGFTAVRLHRRQLKNAPYNPRVISDNQRRKLKEGLEALKLLSPLTWNVRTGNLVSGHQRIAIMDDLEGTDNYLMDVAQCDLSEKQEIEANILLNNPEAQGEWDFEKLAPLLKDPEIHIEATGFDTADIYRLLGDQALEERPEAQARLADDIREIKKKYDAIEKRNAKRDSHAFYLVVVFRNEDDRKAFTDDLGLDDNRYQDGMQLRRLYHRSRDDDGDQRISSPSLGRSSQA